jgi:hypothetical protein
MAAANDPRSLTDILAAVVNEFTNLVFKETQLARAEMSEKLNDLLLALALAGGGAVVLVPALVILLQAAVAGLEVAEIPTVWATLIVGGAALLVGIVLVLVGIRWLKSLRPVPTKTIDQLQHDAALAKSQMGYDDGTTKRAA